MKNKICSLTLLILLLFSSLSHSNSLKDFLNNLQTLNVRFAQNEENNQSKPSYGKLIIKVPGKFVWQNQDKQKQDVIADGEKMWIYEKDLNQVSVYEQSEILLNTPAVLVSNPKSFSDNFMIDQQRKDDAGIWYGLSPKQKNSYYDYIEVYITQGKLKEFHIANRLSDSLTRIEFYYTDKSLNAPIDDTVFDFIVPNGADVLN